MIKTHEVGAELTRKKINNEEDQAWLKKNSDIMEKQWKN